MSYPSLSTKHPEKLLEGVQRRDGSVTGSPALRGALSPGPYDPADPMMLEVSVTDRDATWSLWEAPTGEF